MTRFWKLHSEQWSLKMNHTIFSVNLYLEGNETDRISGLGYYKNPEILCEVKRKTNLKTFFCYKTQKSDKRSVKETFELEVCRRLGSVPICCTLSNFSISGLQFSLCMTYWSYLWCFEVKKTWHVCYFVLIMYDSWDAYPILPHSVQALTRIVVPENMLERCHAHWMRHT